MTSEPSISRTTPDPAKRALASVLGVSVGMLFLVVSIASILIGLSVSSLFVVAPVAGAVGMSVVALARAVSEPQKRLARRILAATGLWLIASLAYLRLLQVELDLVSQAKSPDLVFAVGWVALAIAVVAYVGLLLMGARLLTRLSAGRASDKQ